MKLTMKQLKQFVHEVIAEAAADGVVQKKYRNSFKRMIKLVATGGTKSSPPYTKTPKMGKSGTPGDP